VIIPRPNQDPQVHAHGINSLKASVESKLVPIAKMKNIAIAMASEVMLPTVGHLRYKAYLSQEAIEQSANLLMLDEYDNLASSFNQVAYDGSSAVGAIRGCIYNPDMNIENVLPAYQVFYKTIDRELGLDNKIFESCRFVTLPGSRKAFHTHLALIKSNCLLSLVTGCQHTITAVRPKHLNFYTRIGFEPCSDPLTYPGLKTKMILLVGRDSQSKIEQLDTTFAPIAHSLKERLHYISCLDL
jgi:hypothetical protein